MKSNLVRVDFRKNDKSEKAQDSNGFCKEFGFTAGMLKGSIAEGRKPKSGS